MTSAPILIVEDEHALGTALSMLVRRMGHLPTLAATATAGGKAIEETEFSALVLDIGLPDMSGLEFLRNLRKSQPALPVLVITAHATLDHAIDSQKSGATAYLTKPLHPRHFEQTLEGLLASRSGAMSRPAPPENKTATLIGAAPCLRDAFLGIARACAGDVPALITGPSGSGKSLTATVIHAHSAQSSQPLRTLDCAAIHEWSADFSPPGTLILDEITTLRPDLQSSLATWLAGPRENRPRILATTTRDPREALESGILREDLFYALSALIIPLPPLRERSGDIPALSDYFIGLHGGVSSPVLTPPVLAALQAYPWPGNVRELRHVLDCALALCGGGPVYPSHLPPHVAAAATTTGEAAPGELDAVLSRWLDAQLAVPESDLPAYDALLEQIESIMLRHLLDRHEHRPTRLAAALRIHRATLRQKLRRLGLQGEDG
ncbi:MAG TPA: response regulator [Luteolibacter sp.]|nr:response regulator [Luteolibacter sp.]